MQSMIRGVIDKKVKSLWKIICEKFIPWLKSAFKALTKGIKEKFIPWIKALDKRVKTAAVVVIDLLIAVPVIWWNCFKIPHEKAIEEFQGYNATYNTEYTSYENTVKKYNDAARTLTTNWNTAAASVDALENTISAPETDDEELLKSIRKTLDGYKSDLETKPNAEQMALISKKGFFY